MGLGGISIRVWGLGFRVQGVIGIRVWGAGFTFREYRVWGLGSGVL